MRAKTGRPRDDAIDDAVLDAVLSNLARDGYAGLSLAAVAAQAGTTRPAIYRRWPDKESLVIDAVERLATVDAPPVSGDPFDDLVAEMEHFRHCISEAGSLPLAGLMLGEGIDPPLREKYHQAVVAPRRKRIRGCFERAIEDGMLPAETDLTIASSVLTGSWYALMLAGVQPPRDWARRVVTVAWTGCAGQGPRQDDRHR
ncbi:TetR/AcrR family transcriptional regulator [Gordonia oryzae]|uniref:TetR/AcrR family transcriptional regulator n=1 Tax=Gordonia oryzae TaxID=2487349 RepID=A0A3N4GFM6_9ACTN|nr:TetR/AcrR family transcriptional regulator [Gordonia oryzae]RPA57861.1 TetR/AcrR family transcriptional regulator [Gordonia oryzae]